MWLSLCLSYLGFVEISESISKRFFIKYGTLSVIISLNIIFQSLSFSSAGTPICMLWNTWQWPKDLWSSVHFSLIFFLFLGLNHRERQNHRDKICPQLNLAVLSVYFSNLRGASPDIYLYYHFSYYFHIAAVTKYRKLGGLKQPKFIIL